MAYAEFPSTLYGDGDIGHAELICMYKKLLDEYKELTTKVTALETRLTNYENTMDEKVSAAVNPSVATAMATYAVQVEGRINAAEDEFTNFTDEIDKKIDAQNTSVTTLSNMFEELDEKFSQLNAKTTAEIGAINDRTQELYFKAVGHSDAVAKSMKEELEHQINTIKDTTNYEAIRWLWQYADNGGGFNAYEWYMLSNITAGDWQKMNLTAEEWYTQAKQKYRRFTLADKMYSPVTGELVDVRAALLDLAEELKLIAGDSLTAEQYDKLKLTAQAYDAHNERAYCYDWKGDVTLV